MDTLSESPRRSPFYALTFRNYRLFFWGQSLSVAGTWMQNVAQSWFVWEITHKTEWLGIVNGANAIPFALCAIWGGQVADRHPRRDILLITQCVAMVFAFALAFLASGWLLPAQAWHIAVLAGLSGVVNAFNMPAQQAFVSDLVEDRTAFSNAIALNSLRFNVARVAGPMLAGLVLTRWGAATCFLLNGVSFLAVIASLLQIRVAASKTAKDRGAVREGFLYIFQNPGAARTVGLISAGALLLWSASTLFPALADILGRGAGGFSQMTSANGVGAILSGLLIASYSDVIPLRVRIYGGAILFAAAVFAASFSPHFSLTLALLVGAGFGMILCANTANIAIQQDIPEALRGRVMAVFTLCFQGVMPFGGLLAGYMAKRLGVMLTIRTNAVIFFCITLCLLYHSLKSRDRADFDSL